MKISSLAVKNCLTLRWNRKVSLAKQRWRLSKGVAGTLWMISEYSLFGLVQSLVRSNFWEPLLQPNLESRSHGAPDRCTGRTRRKWVQKGSAGGRADRMWLGTEQHEPMEGSNGSGGSAGPSKPGTQGYSSLPFSCRTQTRTCGRLDFQCKVLIWPPDFLYSEGRKSSLSNAGTGHRNSYHLVTEQKLEGLGQRKMCYKFTPCLCF